MTALLLVLCSALVFGAAETQLTGRWIFQGLSDSGRKVPLFIIDFPEPGKAGLVSTTAPFEISVKSVSVENGAVTIELLADQRPLTLKGTIEEGVIKGKTTGQALNGFSFLAERTELKELKKIKQPAAEELEAFQNARNTGDLSKRLVGLRDFLAKYPETALRTSALLEILDASLESDQPDDKIAETANEAVASAEDKAVVMNDVAFRLAEKNRLLQKSEELARQATDQAKPGSPAKGNFLDTLGWALYKQGKLDQSVAVLRQALQILPREGDIAEHLAEVFEKQGKNDEAAEAYLQAYVGGGNRRARNTARELFRKQKGSLEGFHELLDKTYANQPPLFEAGRFEGNYSGPALLAELFTGSQCGPCQSADYAFDGLISHFPEKTLNVLQYHLHVPGPDPMTNPDSIARARFYKVRATPLALFSGTDKHPGGGPMARAEMAFNEYMEVIKAQLQPGEKARIDLQVKGEKDNVTANGKVTLPTGTEKADVRLFVALVEKTVHYTGSNGVHLHRNVVRKLLNGGEGTRITTPDFEFKQTGSVSAIEAELKQYLDQLSKEWELTFEEAPTSFNRAELAVVAFVQNAETYQILGSVMAPVVFEAGGAE